MKAALHATRSYSLRRACTAKSKQLGQGMSEYLIITALIAVAGIGVFASFGEVISNQAAAMATELAGGSGTNARTAAQNHGTTAVSTASKAVTTLGNYDDNGQGGGGSTGQ